jgi:hypothetical protein
MFDAQRGPAVSGGRGTTTTMLKYSSADLRGALDAWVAAIAARPQNGAVSHWAAR